MRVEGTNGFIVAEHSYSSYRRVGNDHQRYYNLSGRPEHRRQCCINAVARLLTRHRGLLTTPFNSVGRARYSGTLVLCFSSIFQFNALPTSYAKNPTLRPWQRAQGIYDLAHSSCLILAVPLLSYMFGRYSQCADYLLRLTASDKYLADQIKSSRELSRMAALLICAGPKNTQRP